jgi:hypothetical protein
MQPWPAALALCGLCHLVLVRQPTVVADAAPIHLAAVGSETAGRLVALSQAEDGDAIGIGDAVLFANSGRSCWGKG